MRRIAAVALLLAPMLATAAPVDLTAEQQARYQDLTGQLRCLVCQNRSIAESDAPLAQDLREIVARQIAAGRSNEQIKEFLVARYGEFVLYNPRFQPATWLLWLGPGLILLVGAAVAFWLWRRGRRRPEPPPPDVERIRQLLDEDRS